MAGHSKKTLRIAIDGRVIKKGAMHGIARYTWELLESFSKFENVHQFFVFASSQSPLLEKVWPKNFVMVEVKTPWISIREQWVLPYLIGKYKIDLFHSPSFVAPVLCPSKMILTIHDLNHMTLPQYYSSSHKIYYSFIVRLGIWRSSRILTVSHFSKRELMRFFKTSEDKVLVTYNGVSKHFQPISEEATLQRVRKIYELPERFILAFNNAKPHKNISKLVGSYLYSSLDIHLVLVGKEDVALLEEAESVGKRGRLHFIPFVEEGDLPALYSLSQLFVFPSEYEGFGLPPLEALACGTPVLANPSSCLREVLGENGFYSEPTPEEEFAGNLEKVLKDLETRGNPYEVSGRVHAKSFSWDKMARETLEAYEACFSSHSYAEGLTRGN